MRKFISNKLGLRNWFTFIIARLLPLVTGPFIGSWLYEATCTNKYENDYGEMVIVPNEYIFLGAAIVMVLTIIPIIFLIRKEFKNDKQNSTK